MTETEDPGYAERDDDETSEQTGGGVDPFEVDATDTEDEEFSPDEESDGEDF